VKIKFILITLFFVGSTAQSQDAKIGDWISLFGNKKIGNHWNWHHEIQYRNYDLMGDLEQGMVRTGLGYDIHDQHQVLLGYGYILSQNYEIDVPEKITTHEHRVFQQYISRQSISRVQLQHRYRFEQRIFSNDFRLRFRYFLGINIGINNELLISKTAYVSFYNELFLNTQATVFDRNRAFAGLGYKINDYARLELGYMNQFFENSFRDQINLVAFFNW
jgi:hypothetical protein